MIYEFKLGRHAVEAIKNCCWMKIEGIVDPSTLIRWLKKFHSGCINLDNQEKSDSSKTVDYKTVLQAIEANLPSSTQSISDELGIVQFSVICSLITSTKASGAAKLCLVSKKLQNFWLILVIILACWNYDSWTLFLFIKSKWKKKVQAL